MDTLKELPPGVDEALDLVGRFDECLVHGFARLGEEQRRALDDLAAVFSRSPLHSALSEAVAAVGRSEFVPRSFLILASARVALLGSVHDGLLAQARAAIGRQAVATEGGASRPPGGSSSVMSSTQHWLAELAIAGFRQLEESSVAPFAATLENLQADADLTGLSALLTGFFVELMQSMPAARMPDVPAFRWGDLWSAAMVRTQELPAPVGFRDTKGTLRPIGLDVQSHENFVCMVLYGLFDDGKVQTVRVPLTHYKVGGIAGADLWSLFGALADPILKALEEHKVLRVTDAELRENGDLILRSPPKVGGDSDPFAHVDRLTALPDPSPVLRHPVHIAELVHLRGGHGLPIADERIPVGSILSPDVIAAAPELLGLLRFDRGGWRLQPLCIRHSILGLLQGGEEYAEARRKQKNPALDILKERSSRLLRK